MSKQKKDTQTLGEKTTPAGKGKRGRRGKGMCMEDRPILEANAAGIDIGAREIFVAVPPDRAEQPVRVFSTFTEDLEKMAEWLVSCGVTTAAMESTGVYWIPLYDVLERRGVKPCLVSARHMKNVPGRRTDWHECQRLQYLHSPGLLRAAFRPDQEVCAVRTLLRHRNELVQMASQHVLHMQKALTQMNFQIQHVISDIVGVTGSAIVEAILAGERDPAVLANLRHSNIKADAETIRKSLEGDWRQEHLFTLRQSRDLNNVDRKCIEDCDREIAERLGRFESKVDIERNPLPKISGLSQKRRTKRTGDFRFDVRKEAYQLYGIDVTQIPGLNGLVIPLFSEVGRDLASRFGNSARFASWLGLCPDNDKSGGKVLWKAVRRIKNVRQYWTREPIYRVSAALYKRLF